MFSNSKVITAPKSFRDQGDCELCWVLLDICVIQNGCTSPRPKPPCCVEVIPTPFLHIEGKKPQTEANAELPALKTDCCAKRADFISFSACLETLAQKWVIFCSVCTAPAVNTWLVFLGTGTTRIANRSTEVKSAISAAPAVPICQLRAQLWCLSHGNEPQVVFAWGFVRARVKWG